MSWLSHPFTGKVTGSRLESRVSPVLGHGFTGRSVESRQSHGAVTQEIPDSPTYVEAMMVGTLPSLSNIMGDKVESIDDVSKGGLGT